jgi:hypothetical protein
MELWCQQSELMLQVCRLPENVHWEVGVGIETSSKCSLHRFCLEEIINTPDTQRFSVKKRIFDFSWAISSCTLYLLCQTLHKRMSFPSGLKKSVHERSYWSPNGSRSNSFNSIIEKYGVPHLELHKDWDFSATDFRTASVYSAKATFKIKVRDKNLRPCCTYGFIGSGI